MSNIAETIVKKCGGAKVVSDWLRVDISRVYRWTYPKNKGGSDGVIPARRQADLLRKARENGIELDPSDFF